MKYFKMTESVSGDIVVLRSNHPINALRRYINECVLVNPNNLAWNFDFEIEDVTKGSTLEPTNLEPIKV
ncbi:hypothetical protein LCGC14_1609190 [marine sediment metagenome]|uniref:Uncharacterized protein n=1 Tax=marine sediment metagenome TaxID=412755 RepID=A0A0F9IVK1_9ZZZZ